MFISDRVSPKEAVNIILDRIDTEKLKVDGAVNNKPLTDRSITEWRQKGEFPATLFYLIGEACVAAHIRVPERRLKELFSFRGMK